MEINSPTGDSAKSRIAEQEAVWPAAVGIALLLTLQFQLVLYRTINWDEFYFLNQVVEFSRGELTTPLQTIHVRLFAWLTEFDIAGVDQIIRGRLVMFAAELFTCIWISLIARRFVSWAQALLCALAYLSVGYVFQHGFAFRTDPLAISFAMAALVVLARARLNWVALIGFGVLLALALMVTIKVVLLAPAFAGLAWLRWAEDGFSLDRAMRIAAAPIIALAVAAPLYIWHGLDLAPAQEAGSMLGHSGQAMFFLGLPENWRFILMAALYGAPFLSLIHI